MKRELRTALAPDVVRFAAAAIVAALVIALVAAAAGIARILPTLLDPEVPTRVARPFLAGLLALALEMGALIGWPLGWAEVSVRSRERGEARARMTLGEAPFMRIARLWPTVLLLSLLTAAGSVAWGRDARGPGRVARALLQAGRATCASATEPRVVAVPLVHATWLCRPGREPLLVGEGAGNSAAIDFAATSFDIADDLTRFEARDAQILVPTNTAIKLTVATARVVGLRPFSAPSSVSPAMRAAVIVAAASICAFLSAISALRGEVAVRAGAWSIALVGPAVALATLRACEQASISDFRLLLVPAAAAAATLAARGFAHVIARSIRQRTLRRLPG